MIKKWTREIRKKLIVWLAGDDISVITNTALRGVIYPRGSNIFLGDNFFVGGLEIGTQLYDMEQGAEADSGGEK